MGKIIRDMNADGATIDDVLCGKQKYTFKNNSHKLS